MSDDKNLASEEHEGDNRQKQLDEIVNKNVQAIDRIERASLSTRTRADIVADAIAGFCGSMAFVYVHCVLFSFWLTWNSVPFIPDHLQFDKPPFILMTLIVSLEAIFLSTFILISQNRQQRASEQRNHLDLQINMLAEQENSRMLVKLDQIMEHLGIENDDALENALEAPTNPERIAEQIERTVASEKREKRD